MNSKRELMTPATIAALLLFVGSTITAPAKADDEAAFDTPEASATEVEDASREQARQANEAAVKEAAEAVEAETLLDLDIRLIGHNSVIIAGEV